MQYWFSTLLLSVLLGGACSSGVSEASEVITSRTPPLEIVEPTTPPEPPPPLSEESPVPLYRETESEIDRRLKAHFERYAIAPFEVFDSKNLGEPQPARQMIHIGPHTVEWENHIDAKRRWTATLRINGEVIPLAGEMTLNEPDDKKFDAGWVNDWWEVRLYKLHDRDILGIEMNQAACTGLGCSVSIQLIYDLKTRKRNFFGTFRTGPQIKLFRFARDDEHFYVSKSCDCMNADGKYVVTYNLYRMRPNGEFRIEMAPGGKPYFIRHTFYPLEFEPHPLREIPQKQADKLEQKWIRPIDE